MGGIVKKSLRSIRTSVSPLISNPAIIPEQTFCQKSNPYTEGRCKPISVINRFMEVVRKYGNMQSKVRQHGSSPVFSMKTSEIRK